VSNISVSKAQKNTRSTWAGLSAGAEGEK